MMMDDEMSMWVRECGVRKETEAERTLRRVRRDFSLFYFLECEAVSASDDGPSVLPFDHPHKCAFQKDREREREKKANRKSIAGGRGKTVDYGGEEED